MPEQAADSVTGAPGVLAGIRVLDCTFGLAGPEATRLLAEAGADVVKVEPPSGDPTRGTAAFSTWNRSKHSVVLDLDDDGDRRRFDRLLAGADVLVHGFRPSRAHELGLDDAALAQRHPHLIASAVTGYPGNHPDAELPGWDILVQARSGAMWEVDGARPGPIFLRLPVPSWSTCYLVTVGILARLLVRQRSGHVGPAHTSLLQGMLAVLALLWHRGEHLTPDMTAKLPLPKGFPAPAMSMFECAEGDWIQLLPGYLEHPLLIETVAELGEYIDVETAYPIPSPEQLTTIRAAFSRRPLPEWLTAFQEGGYPAEPVRALGTVFSDSQAIENGYVVELDDPKLGRVRQSGPPYEMTPAATVYGAAPDLGSVDADEVAWDPRTRSGVADGPGLEYPLAGLRVLDLGMFLASPLASMLFADMGAEVIKVEPPTGDRMRVPTQMTLFVGCQRGKRAIVLDLTESGVAPGIRASGPLGRRRAPQPALKRRAVAWGRLRIIAQGQSEAGLLPRQCIRRARPQGGLAGLRPCGTSDIGLARRVDSVRHQTDVVSLRHDGSHRRDAVDDPHSAGPAPAGTDRRGKLRVVVIVGRSGGDELGDIPGCRQQ